MCAYVSVYSDAPKNPELFVVSACSSHGSGSLWVLAPAFDQWFPFRAEDRDL